MGNLSSVLHFGGTWRTYQARVLSCADKYLDDGKIHIVAAPGSGKTTLGIELIGRIGEPVLILAPSVTIREQWKDRIVSAFLKEGEDPDKWISQSLKAPAQITIATYQALHSAMTRYAGVLSKSGDEEDDSDDVDEADIESVDFSGFNLVATMKGIGASVLCLDECHHLRSEWWKALEDYRAQMGEQKIIALTATPPYDSTPAGWKRYMDMCGDIDEEITVPELVKEGSLCPHQDFVYFNFPTKEELSILDDFEDKSKMALDSYMADPTLQSAIQGHKIFTGAMTLDEILEEPSYLSALIIYMNEKKLPVPAHLKKVLGAKKFPPMSAKWMEIILQKFLFDGVDDFMAPIGYQEQMANDMKRRGLINKRKVTLSASTSVEKMLLSSKGKINSILDISDYEYSVLGDGLRMLILTDYIRREFEHELGGSAESVDSMGVLPFFEAVRKHFDGKKDVATKPKLCVLCGTVVIIPAGARDALVSIAEESVPGNGSKLNFSRVGQLSESDYIKVSAIGSGNFLTGAVTELFTRGYINIMIGTKSLLGEGWDSPCINSLILASFVGSFMLSNQMRGRAIRTMKGNPDKNSNIWHLVCVKPQRIINQELRDGIYSRSNSEDWELLERRMEHFMGLHYDDNYIENGTRRLSCIQFPFTKDNVEATNSSMLMESGRRAELKQRWQDALTVKNSIEVVDETEVPDNYVTAVVFYDAIRLAVFGAVVFLVNIILSIVLGGVLPFLFAALAIVGIIILVVNLPKLISMSSPLKRLKTMGKGILSAMQKKGMLSAGNSYRVESEVNPENPFCHSVYLLGGTSRDKQLFAKCLNEFYAAVENQRYLLVNPKNKRNAYAYYCVPEEFANNKENAQLFNDCMRPYIGKYDLVYTRNAEGRKVLMHGRTHAYANRQERAAGKRTVKSALE
ncbi:MAG: DEAD/DEAH box helicase family protein [Saccharofermentans sp.]|nr:DEAD/DEAH box helicase family protein [Saccharofermentans sp.]